MPYTTDAEKNPKPVIRTVERRAEAIRALEALEK
jgi:hypothetical protein